MIQFYRQSHSKSIINSLLWSITSLAMIDSRLSIAQSPPSKPKIPTELQRLEYFEGTWRCQQPANSTKPSGGFSWTVKQDLNQFWYLGNAQQIDTSPGNLPINSREFMGYDSASKKLIRSVVVGNGSSYNLVAEDWEDNQLIWSGVIVRKEQATPLRQEIIKNSSNKFTTIYFFPNKNEEWIPVVDESCTRFDPDK